MKKINIKIPFSENSHSGKTAIILYKPAEKTATVLPYGKLKNTVESNKKVRNSVKLAIQIFDLSRKFCRMLFIKKICTAPCRTVQICSYLFYSEHSPAAAGNGYCNYSVLQKQIYCIIKTTSAIPCFLIPPYCRDHPIHLPDPRYAVPTVQIHRLPEGRYPH